MSCLVRSINDLGRPYIIDLESTNATRVNDDAIPTTRYYELRAGDGVLFILFFFLILISRCKLLHLACRIANMCCCMTNRLRDSRPMWFRRKIPCDADLALIKHWEVQFPRLHVPGSRDVRPVVFQFTTQVTNSLPPLIGSS